MSKEREIRFRSDQVRAILEGRQTQTRRLVPNWQLPGPTYDGEQYISIAQRDPRWGFGVFGKTEAECMANYSDDYSACCPYGKRGDRLWAREKFATHFIWDGLPPGHIDIQKHADCFFYGDGTITGGCEDHQRGKWRPSIHMPRWASRITLEITGVRVERLQDISEEDAKAEGVHSYDDFPTDSCCPRCQGQGVHGAAGPNLGWIEVDCQECETAEKRFRHLWESINGPDSWDANPWVWVIEFKRVDQEGSSDA